MSLFFVLPGQYTKSKNYLTNEKVVVCLGYIQE